MQVKEGTSGPCASPGFGADVSKTLVAREERLITKRMQGSNSLGPSAEAGHAAGLKKTEASPRSLRKCPRSREFHIRHHSRECAWPGTHVGTIDLPLQRLAVIRGRHEFTLVLWRP